LKKDECWITHFKCKQYEKTSCKFFLKFKRSLKDCQEDQANYILIDWNQVHNQDFDKFDSADRVTEDIKKIIKRLRGKCLNDGALTAAINQEFKTNYKTEVIHHQVKLLEVKANGPASEDAQTLVELLRNLLLSKITILKKKWSKIS